MLFSEYPPHFPQETHWSDTLNPFSCTKNVFKKELTGPLFSLSFRLRTIWESIHPTVSVLQILQCVALAFRQSLSNLIDREWGTVPDSFPA